MFRYKNSLLLLMSIMMLIKRGVDDTLPLEVHTNAPSPKRSRSRSPTKSTTHKCSTCNKEFFNISTKNRHEATVHPKEDEPIYTCPKCPNKTFSRPAFVKRHERMFHEAPNKSVQCGHCYAFMPNLEALDKHSRRLHNKPKVAKQRAKREHVAEHLESATDFQLPPIDPAKFPSGLQEHLGDVGQLYQENWNHIRTKSVTGKFQDQINIRMPIASFKDVVYKIHTMQSSAYKLNATPGFILRNRLTDETRFYYGCCNNSRVFDQPFLVHDDSSLKKAVEGIADFGENAFAYAYAQKPNSSWIVDSITNVTFVITKLPNYTVGHPPSDLPDHIRNNQGITTLLTNSGPITDSLCVFRCLSLHFGSPDAQRMETDVKALFAQYQQTLNKPATISSFKGIPMNKLSVIEECFNVGIMVYNLENDDEIGSVATLTRRPAKTFESVMKVCIFEEHFMFVNDFGKFAHMFSCVKCDKLWKCSRDCEKHQKTCTGAVKLQYSGGVYHPSRTIFDQLADESIDVPKQDRIIKQLAVFDFECMQIDEKHTSQSGDFEVTKRHIPISVSVCSNVSGFTKPKCFVSTGDVIDLITRMHDYLTEIAVASHASLRTKHSAVITQLQCKDAKTREQIHSEGGNEKPNLFYAKLLDKFDAHLQQLVVLGFNSGKYDINCCKSILLPHLARSSEIKFVVKRTNNFMAISTPDLKFMDMCNFLAVGWSYAKLLKAFKINEQKGSFPHEWMTSLDKLDTKGLPDRSKFRSELKNEDLSDEDYAKVEQVWEREGMTTLRHLLVYYNNLDCSGLVLACEKYRDIYSEDGLDAFHDAISVPGLAFRDLFQDIDNHFYLFTEKDKELYHTMRANLVGGPSTIFKRYSERDITKIRNGTKWVKSIHGFDSNSLYMGATTLHDMPCGMYNVRDEANGFRPKYPRKYGRMAKVWHDWTAQNEHIKIRHQFNSTEKRLNDLERPVRVDGWCAETKTAYQFHGCHFHGHMDCPINHRDVLARADDDERATLSNLLETRAAETKETSKLIRNGGYELIELYECEWLQMIRDDPELKQYADDQKTEMERRCGYKHLKQADIIQAIEDGILFGVVECDITVPDVFTPDMKKRLATDLSPRDYFSEMQPIFKNCEVTIDDIGECMKQYVTNNGLSTKPKKLLVGSYFATKAMFATPLLQWYLSHGVQITHVYRVIEYHRAKPFVAKGTKICDIRRAADRDPDLAIIADTFKTKGNSYYGKSITDQLRHVMVKYVGWKPAQKLVNSMFFRTLETLDPEHDDPINEVVCNKKTVRLNLPIQIGFFVYQLAKLRMLQFHYDCIDTFVDRSDYELCQMDTDSYYAGFSAATIFDVIKPERERQFYDEYNRWFPSQSCDEHKEAWISSKMARQKWIPKTCCEREFAYHARTPELFKNEFCGTGIIGLCSKTYFCFGDNGEKFSAKGVNRRACTAINKQVYLDVLQTQKTVRVTNMGFRALDHQIKTYIQRKDGFTYNYWKRIVHDDGITTGPTLV